MNIMILITHANTPLIPYNGFIVAWECPQVGVSASNLSLSFHNHSHRLYIVLATKLCIPMLVCELGNPDMLILIMYTNGIIISTDVEHVFLCL